MTNSNRFDAALRAHVFDRPFSEGEVGAAPPGAPPSNRATAEPRSQDYASELEAALMRDLNKLTTGLRPKKLLPDRGSPQAPAVPVPSAAAEAKRQSRYAPPSRLRPAASPQTAEPAPTMSPYAPPPKLPPAPTPAAEASAPPGEARQVDEKPPSPYAPQAKRPALSSARAPLPRPAARALPADPAPATTPAPTPAAAVRSKPADPTAAPPKAESRYAPPKRPAYPGAIPRETGISAAPLAPAAPERPTVAHAPADSERLAAPEDGAEVIAAIEGGDAAEPSIVSLSGNEAEAESEPFDGPTVNELARLYAPRPPAAASVAPDVRPEPAATAESGSPYAPPRQGKRATAAPGIDDTPPPVQDPRPARRPVATAGAVNMSKPRPIRWQARDEVPGGWFRPLRGGNWPRRAAVALVLVGLIGGAGAVVTFESLAPAESGPAVAAADRAHPEAASEEDVAAGAKPPTGNLTVAARVRAGVEVVHADDAGKGLAPAEGTPLPGSAKVIPLPLPVQTGAELRPTRDAAPGENLGATETSGAASPADAAAGADEAASDEPARDGEDVTADGGDIPAGPAPRAPTPRPEREGAAAGGALAYAPTADPIDRGAKAFAGKGDEKTAGKAPPKAGSARIASWVNMRASADNKAATVKVLPAGSVVTVVQCSYWCEILADGKRGFVYKKFLQPAGGMASGQ